MSNPDLTSWHEARREVCAWLRANGVDPARTPIDPHATVANGQLTLLQKTGPLDQLDPDEPNRVMTHTITVPIVLPVEPGSYVETWLAPHCPTCGR